MYVDRHVYIYPHWSVMGRLGWVRPSCRDRRIGRQRGRVAGPLYPLHVSHLAWAVLQRDNGINVLQFSPDRKLYTVLKTRNFPPRNLQKKLFPY